MKNDLFVDYVRSDRQRKDRKDAFEVRFGAIVIALCFAVLTIALMTL